MDGEVSMNKKRLLYQAGGGDRKPAGGRSIEPTSHNYFSPHAIVDIRHRL